MPSLKPDIIARVTLLPTQQGGRRTTVPPAPFGCPFFIGGEGFDCRLLLDQAGVSLAPGSTTDVPIKFLFLDLVKDRLKSGARFELWESRVFAKGEILQVLI